MVDLTNIFTVVNDVGVEKLYYLGHIHSMIFLVTYKLAQ
jgi:hypothetical protein